MYICVVKGAVPGVGMPPMPRGPMPNAPGAK